jgi:hypothetical protein
MFLDSFTNEERIAAVRIVASMALVVAIAACRNDHKWNPNEADPQLEAARPLAGCYLLAGDNVGPYRVQLYSWRSARAWVVRPLGSDTIAGTTSNEWSWTPGGPDSFDVRRGGADGVMDFVVRRSDSSWSAVMLVPSSNAARNAATPAHVERVECPSAEAGANEERR